MKRDFPTIDEFAANRKKTPPKKKAKPAPAPVRDPVDQELLRKMAEDREREF